VKQSRTKERDGSLRELMTGETTMREVVEKKLAKKWSSLRR
jgi:hypothetical protein